MYVLFRWWLFVLHVFIYNEWYRYIFIVYPEIDILVIDKSTHNKGSKLREKNNPNVIENINGNEIRLSLVRHM